METREMKKFEQEMMNCIRCGYCFEFCPTFAEEGWEAASSRGRLAMAWGMLQGHLAPNEKIAQRFFQCTTCKDCMNRCASKVDIYSVIEAARVDLVRAGFSTEAQRTLVKNLTEKGNIFGETEVGYNLQEGDTPVFVGCNYLARPNAVKRWMKIFEAVGLKPKTVKEWCCGFPLKVIGFHDDLGPYAERFREHFPFETAITFCPSCTMFLKEEYGIATQNVMTAVLPRLEVKKKLGTKVTYQDPCDLGRGFGVFDDPRKLIAKLGLDLVEMQFSGKDARCCGGGGGILTADTELSKRMAHRRIHEAIDTGAEVLVTACANCENTLRQAAQEVGRQGDKTIVVKDVADLIWTAMK